MQRVAWVVKLCSLGRDVRSLCFFQPRQSHEGGASGGLAGAWQGPDLKNIQNRIQKKLRKKLSFSDFGNYRTNVALPDYEASLKACKIGLTEWKLQNGERTAACHIVRLILPNTHLGSLAIRKSQH